MSIKDRLRASAKRRLAREHARPFIKWVGGKRSIMLRLLQCAPPKYRRYFEPFVGGGGFFYALKPLQAVLADSLVELMDGYRAVKLCVEEVIEHLRKHENTKTHYYTVRNQNPKKLKLAERAARLIFLNKAGFNGVYRVNQKGVFNVPYGDQKKAVICDKVTLRACASLLEHADIRCGDYAETIRDAVAGDFVYFDPPYFSTEAGFAGYTASGFGAAEHERLAQCFRRLADAGIYVMLSNADCEEVRRLYSGFVFEQVRAPRHINRDGEGRGKVGELIIRNYTAFGFLVPHESRKRK